MVNGVIVEPPSLPLITKSLSDTTLVITKSPELAVVTFATSMPAILISI